jgi:hypothetical protein
MAKKQDKQLVDCKTCIYSDTVAVNVLLPCRNKERNPDGFKVGDWLRECDYYKRR